MFTCAGVQIYICAGVQIYMCAGVLPEDMCVGLAPFQLNADGDVVEQSVHVGTFYRLYLEL